MKVIQNFLEARLLADLDYNLLDGIWKRLGYRTTPFTQRGRTEDNTKQSEDDQL